MNAYQNLASSYDRLTNDVDYAGWVDFAQAILEKEGLKPRTVADLACGTGSVTRILAERGYRVTAVDLSESMLTEAMDKCADLEILPTFVHQNLAELRLPRAVDMAVCFLDSLDYILDPADCEAAIRRTYKALNPGGIFIFDVNTPEKLRAMDGQGFLTRMTMCTASGGASLMSRPTSAPTAWTSSSERANTGSGALKSIRSTPTPSTS